MINEFKALGFQLVQTGGNCTAFDLDLGDSKYVRVTHEGGIGVPETLEEECLVGFINEATGMEGDILPSGITAKEVIKFFSNPNWKDAI